MGKILRWTVCLLFFASCRTNPVFINILAPAQVTLSNSIKKVGLLNRSIPVEERKENVLHQINSTGSMAMIREGSAESLRGLKDALMQNTRFESVRTLDSIMLNAEIIGMFASPLSWDQVEVICRDNNLDALFVLELFDTEFKVGTRLIPATVENPIQILNAIRNIEMTMMVKTGWRIYDPVAHMVVDEFSLSRSITISVNGNPAAAAEGLIKRKESVKQTANLAGHLYANRILPAWFRASRDYFIRGGSENFKIAKRKARSGNWDGAGELWMKETSSTKRKPAGRACYNMAIINEINGKPDDAIKWAQKAYEDYNVRLARNYIYILTNRKRAENLLDIQQTR